MFNHIVNLKALGKWNDTHKGIVADFVEYLEHMKDARVKGLRMSKDRDFDIGAIDFCSQSIESAKALT